MPQRIELNVTTGERKVIELTPTEITAAAASLAKESAEKAAAPAPVDVSKLEAWAKSMGYTP